MAERESTSSSLKLESKNHDEDVRNNDSSGNNANEQIVTDNSTSSSSDEDDTNNNTSSSSLSRPATYSPVILIKPNLFVERTAQLWKTLSVSEMSGSMGDLGTFIPIVITLARQRSILLAPTLFFAGLSNVVTGYLWDVPMCVQPMKSIAAVALSEGLSREEVTAAGIWMGAFMVVLGTTQLIELVNIIIPAPVVSGLQVGVGLRLASKGITMISSLSWVDQPDCILLALCLSLLCLYWLREKRPASKSNDDSNSDRRSNGDENNQDNNSDEEKQGNIEGDDDHHYFSIRRSNRDLGDDINKRKTLFDIISCCCRAREKNKKDYYHPVGLYLFGVGIIFATIELITTSNADGQYDLPLQFFGAPVATWALDGMTWLDYKVGLLEGAIPQLPLTTLNSVISVCCLAHSLYPEKRKHNNGDNTSSENDDVISRREVSISVGLMNLLTVPFGGMTNCHGAGGLAGQHRLGARYGSSVVFLGINKILLAIFFGASLLTLLDAMPNAVLGILLGIAGQELTTTGFILLTKVNEPEGGKDHGNGENDNENTRRQLRQNVVIAIITAMVIVSLGKTHYGALSGWVAYMIYGDGISKFVLWIRSRRYGRTRSTGDSKTLGGNV